MIFDVKKKIFGNYELYTLNGTKNSGLNPFEFAENMEKLGAGEKVVNSIDNDGAM
jgi:cyclase